LPALTSCVYNSGAASFVRGTCTFYGAVRSMTVESGQKPYRQNVGMVVFNQLGEVLVGERENIPRSWQFPQGGIDTGEEPKAAALRELYEEVGIIDPELVHETQDWLYYNFPPDLKLSSGMAKYRGQMQKWFLFYWNHPASECNLCIHEQEFREVKFIPFARCIEAIVDFKKPIYIELVKLFSPSIGDRLNIPR
jgi:putative (di)nucleoside polyphosphate hydrolase